MISRRRHKANRSGCGLLIVACIVSCLLLVLNRMLVASTYTVLVPEGMTHPKIRHVVLFLGMVILLIPEWWLIDLLADRARRFYRAMDAKAGGRDTD